MIVPTSLLSLAQVILSTFSPAHPTPPPPPSSLSSSIAASPSSSHTPASLIPSWLDLPIDSDTNMRLGASVSSCTFTLGPPGPPPSALCPAFLAHCTRFKRDYHSRKLRSLKTSPLFSPTYTATGDDEDECNPLRGVKFRAGCTGGAGTASDGSYISGYTATCVVEGVDWVPFVFSDFLQSEFGVRGEGGEEGLSIYSSFVGCQVPARL